jgi:hypothetical protein
LCSVKHVESSWEKKTEKRKNISKISKEARAISEDSYSILKQSHEDSHT